MGVRGLGSPYLESLSSVFLFEGRGLWLWLLLLVSEQASVAGRDLEIAKQDHC